VTDRQTDGQTDGIAIACALTAYAVARKNLLNVDQLKQAIVEEWNKLSQRFIDRSIDEWRRPLTWVVQQQDGHIEHIAL